MSYTAMVADDNNTAEVVLELHGQWLGSPNAVTASIGPRQARRIAIQMLEAADRMDDLRDQRG